MRAGLRAGGILAVLLASTRLLACGGGDRSSSGRVDLDGDDGGLDGATAADDAGSSDGSQGSDGAPKTACDAYDASWFCADFDRSPDPAAGWTGIHSQGEGGIGLDSTHFVSPGSSLHTLLFNDTPGSINYRQRVVKLVGSTQPRYELAFDVQIAQATDVTGAVAIGELSFEQNSAGDQYVFIGAAASGLVLGNDWYPNGVAPVLSSTPIAPLPLSKFTHVDLVVELAAPVGGVMTGTATVTVDGAVVIDHVALNAPIAAAVNPSVGVGPSTAHAATTEGWIDNVLVYPQ